MDFLHKQKKKNLNEERLKFIEKKYEKMKKCIESEDSKESEEESSEFSLSKIGNED